MLKQIMTWTSHWTCCITLFFFCLGDDFDFHFEDYSSFHYCPHSHFSSLVVVNLMTFMSTLAFCKTSVQMFSWFSSCSIIRMCEIHFWDMTCLNFQSKLWNTVLWIFIWHWLHWFINQLAIHKGSRNNCPIPTVLDRFQKVYH